jgi:hypothetical protein
MNFSLIHWKVPYQFIREKWIEKTNKMNWKDINFENFSLIHWKVPPNHIFIDGLSCDVVGIHGI